MMTYIDFWNVDITNRIYKQINSVSNTGKMTCHQNMGPTHHSRQQSAIPFPIRHFYDTRVAVLDGVVV